GSVGGARLGGWRERDGNRAGQRGGKCLWVVEAGEDVDDLALRGEDVVDGVAGDGALEGAAIAEVDGDDGDGALGGPDEDEAVAEKLRDLLVGVQRGAEE